MLGAGRLPNTNNNFFLESPGVMENTQIGLWQIWVWSRGSAFMNWTGLSRGFRQHRKGSGPRCVSYPLSEGAAVPDTAGSPPPLLMSLSGCFPSHKCLSWSPYLILECLHLHTCTHAQAHTHTYTSTIHSFLCSTFCYNPNHHHLAHTDVTYSSHLSPSTRL